MKPYIVIVHKDEHSAYGMSFPDAPGCFSAADEIDDIFAMASEALALWAEGMREDGLPIPEPRDFETLAGRSEMGGALRRCGNRHRHRRHGSDGERRD